MMFMIHTGCQQVNLKDKAPDGKVDGHHHSSMQKIIVLVSSGTELFSFLLASRELWFGFHIRIILIILLVTKLCLY